MRPEFNPQYLQKKLSVLFAWNLGTGEAKTGKSLGLLAIQAILPDNFWANGRPLLKKPRGGFLGVKPENDLCAPNASAHLYTHPHTVRCIHKPTHINTTFILLSIDNKSISTSSIITSIDNQPFFSGLFSGGPYAGQCWVRSYKKQKIYKYSKQLGSRFIQNFLSARRDGRDEIKENHTQSHS